jgi:hypothetical protein
MSREFNVGMQVHPHDTKFEGADVVVTNMRNLADVTTVYPICNYYEERQPIRGMEFPHNPSRKSYRTAGGVYFDPHLEYYKKSVLKPQRTPDSDLRDFDALGAIADSAEEKGVRVLPWILSLTDSMLARKYGRYSMVDIYGKKVFGWLCPSFPEVRRYVLSLIKDILSSYDVDGIFFDRFRFPEWAGPGKGFSSVFTCFCRQCSRRARKSGIDLGKTRKTIKRIADAANLNRLPLIVSAFQRYRKGSLDLAKVFTDMPELVEWIIHRQDVITDFAAAAYDSVKDIDRGLEFSLDLWPPSYSWLLGQNYQKLSRHCDSLKYFVYHKVGGGEDIRAMFRELKSRNPDLDVRGFIDLFYRFFGFSGPGDLEELGERGLAVDFVLEETLKVLDETENRVRVYPGIQIFGMTAGEVRETVRKCLEADVDGIVAFCYGWATLDNIRAFGDGIREFARA